MFSHKIIRYILVDVEKYFSPIVNMMHEVYTFLDNITNHLFGQKLL